ncbi:DUF533 domain-containing protein [Desulfonema ishimotonii]|uniref:DUF533 domain-containing protein n=1 Tax=Desulfonema ishimotonii TaxID=45657 RepID=A0A401FU21_9BACT|nr:tellurite resistance TerB family protein [Desulfonema ishimotonii]GBC60469.1 DUF533 domain-containing protein [Desulfonema ishimotonii]
MINPEKILGSLLGSSLRGSGINLGSKAQIGLGLLGVALGAAEHFMKSSSSPEAAPPPPGHMPSVPPPPPPSVRPSAPPIQSPEENNAAILLIRAMIASANADGVIDTEERTRILEKLEAANLNEEERAFILYELSHPADIGQIIPRVDTPELAEQVYAVSLLAIEIDTEAERDYIRALAEKLNLGQDAMDEVHRKLNITGL